ncbi:hypothetical protein WG904_08575 [Pedobacter sp. Du54]|uniref:hypothetical protein n=1 Tax=Pedobacter anseongensis TaxID=3133439 RepID=UPI0030B34C62
MKIYLKLIFAIMLPLCGFSQQKLSDATSFSHAIELATTNKKPLLIIIGIKLPENVTFPVVPNKAISDPEVFQKMKTNFVVYETDRGNEEIKPIITKFKIVNFPTFLFMHANGDVFHSEFGYGVNKNKYLLMLNRAISYSKEKSLSELEDYYVSHKEDNVALKKLIETRVRNGLTDNSKLIESYVNNLKIADLSDYETVLFILKSGPLADGNAFKMAYSNRKIVDSIFKVEPIQSRIAINNTIIANTMANAIKTKNRSQAITAANLARSTNGSDYQAGNRGFYTNILNYYRAVKDTANYIRTAISFYDSNYMTISADSIKKIEAKQRQRNVVPPRVFPGQAYNPNNLSQRQIDSLKADPRTVVRRETSGVMTSMVSMSNSYASALNSAAWAFYMTGTKNINFLLKAVSWATRSLELNKSPNAYDTLARLFYQLGYFEQAIKTEQTAIEQAQQNKVPYENLRDVLKKMKNKTLTIEGD